MYSQLKHIFFDLDNTLWDFEKNSKKVILELFSEFNLQAKCKCLPDSFYKTYVIVNEQLWKLYREKLISKDELRSSRFTNTMLYFGYQDEQLGKKLEEEYISKSPLQKELVDGTIEVLEYLKTKYQLHIITNGFKEIQHIKIENCGLKNYFNHIIISEEVGYNKPDKLIFDFALNKCNALNQESLMIGDDFEADIKGAQNAGFNTIFFNRKSLKFEDNSINQISSLNQILKIIK
jgi:putative hydrolase of the HAD superfamily